MDVRVILLLDRLIDGVVYDIMNLVADLRRVESRRSQVVGAIVGDLGFDSRCWCRRLQSWPLTLALPLRDRVNARLSFGEAHGAGWTLFVALFPNLVSYSPHTLGGDAQTFPLYFLLRQLSHIRPL